MDNKPLTRLPVRTSGLHQPPNALLHVPGWTATTQPLVLQAFVDAGTHNCFVTTSLTCPFYPALEQSCAYETLQDLPIGRTIAAIRDGLLALSSTETSAAKLTIFTDSTASIRDLRRVSRCTSLAASIHAIMDTYLYPVRALWIRSDMLPPYIAAYRACHRRDLPLPLHFFECPP